LFNIHFDDIYWFLFTGYFALAEQTLPMMLTKRLILLSYDEIKPALLKSSALRFLSITKSTVKK